LDRGVKEKNMALILDGTTGIGIDSGTQPLDPASLNAVIQALIPTGTKMLFQQTAAPTGWTKDTTHDNKALRVVSGTASTGGSVAFTTAFASQAVSGTVGSTTLTTAEIPSHNHSFTSRFAYDPGSSGNWGVIATSSTGNPNGPLGGVLAVSPTAGTGSGGSHNHSFTGTAINLAVSYVDLIIATKD
jgi:hypothetical protein